MKNNSLSSLSLFCVVSFFVLTPVGCGENETQIEIKKANKYKVLLELLLLNSPLFKNNQTKRSYSNINYYQINQNNTKITI